MYLRELFIQNNGPIRNLHLEPTFDDQGLPIPHIIVGRNGSGKTNLLSIIADALMQGASSAFTDVLTQKGLGRSYFRIVGGDIISYGESHGFSVLRFSDESGPLFYRENIGEISADQASNLLPETMKAGATWQGTDSSKEFKIDNDKARTIFESGVYAYFPASRSEHPHWFNKDSISSDEYDLTPRYLDKLGKRLYVEQGIDAFAQWLLGVITEARPDVLAADYADGGRDKEHAVVTLDTVDYMENQKPLIWANSILQTIMDDPSAKFVWTGRRNHRKVAVHSNNQRLASGLNSLSGGQATMLAAFGTILRYADSAWLGPGEVEGVVLIDELDAHMHIDLQLKALPKLIKFFPKIQFFISSHSPFFALGMERELSASGVRVLEMPHATPVVAESYEEFQRALNAFQETKAFTNIIKKELEAGEEPLILLAGETDLKYFKTAAQVLGYTSLIGMFDWIGAESGAGGGKFTGDSSLDQTAQLFRANPNLTKRKIVLVYDCDAKVREESFASVHILPINQVKDAYCQKGIENLLPKHVFTEEMYDRKEYPTGYGAPKIIPELRKMQLCEKLCAPDADVENFRNFEAILKRIHEIISPGGESDSVTAECSAAATD